MSREGGVTLVETMVTVAIAAVLLALAVPGLIDFMRDVRLDSRVADMVGALSFTRSEAIKRGHPVTLCPSSDGASCRTDKIWEAGWIVFSDPNANGDVDTGEQILRMQGAPDGNGTLRGGRKKVTYKSSGFSPNNNDTLRFCDPRGTEKARRVIINNQGRARVTKQTDTCP